jgi:hypothetical protein
MSEAASRQVSPALERAYQFLAWLIPTLDKFPRRQKFLLGDRIESTALDVLEGLVEATYTRNRARLLEAVNLNSISCAFCFGYPRNCSSSIDPRRRRVIDAIAFIEILSSIRRRAVCLS